MGILSEELSDRGDVSLDDDNACNCATAIDNRRCRKIAPFMCDEAKSKIGGESTGHCTDKKRPERERFTDKSVFFVSVRRGNSQAVSVQKKAYRHLQAAIDAVKQPVRTLQINGTAGGENGIQLFCLAQRICRILHGAKLLV